MKAWEDYYSGVKEYVDALKEYGLEVPEAYDRFLTAYASFQREYSGMKGLAVNGHAHIVAA